MFAAHDVKADIICIGDELLIGQVINTNAAWIGKQLNVSGISVRQQLVVSDAALAITEAFTKSSHEVQICIVTGGLGPTKDDITKSVIAALTHSRMRMREAVLQHLEKRFATLQRPLNTLNRLQAEIPESCDFFQNTLGTAPGLHFKLHTCVFYILPGVPYEMKALFENNVLPQLKTLFKLPVIKHLTIVTGGIAESALAELLDAWEQQLAALELKLAYLPRPGQVRLRLSGSHADAHVLEKRIQNAYNSLMPLISSFFIGIEEFENEGFHLAQQVVEQLKLKQLSISIAESCTGGQLSAALTAIAGASAVFKGSCVPYSNAMKQQLLQVDSSVFDMFGAVSKECVLQMVKGCKTLFNSDIAVSISGIAGPGGATPEKPVGLVWMGFAIKDKIITERFIFGADRIQNINYSVQTALRIVLKHL